MLKTISFKTIIIDKKNSTVLLIFMVACKFITFLYTFLNIINTKKIMFEVFTNVFFVFFYYVITLFFIFPISYFSTLHKWHVLLFFGFVLVLQSIYFF